MKRNKISMVLAVCTLIFGLWATSAMALSFTISGYTNTLWVTDPISGALVNGPGTGTGQSGQYTLSFFGGTGNVYNASGLQGSLSIVADDGSPNYSSGIMNDLFYIRNIGGVFTLGSAAGDLLQLGMQALPADPNFPAVVTAPALMNTNNTYAYVNQVTLDASGVPVSFGLDGLPTNPTTAYGYSIADGFLSTDATGNIIDLVIADANVPVPEPSAILLIGAGLAGLAFYRRRQNA